MVFLTLDDVFRLHERIIQQTGGSTGTRDREGVHAALLQPFATFDGQALYPTLIEKAAVAGYMLICNHPFIDGNKRIGHAVMEVILVLNGYELIADVAEQEHLILQVAEGKVTREEFSDWVNSVASRLPN